jgi:hypothetical protein
MDSGRASPDKPEDGWRWGGVPCRAWTSPLGRRRDGARICCRMRACVYHAPQAAFCVAGSDGGTSWPLLLQAMEFPTPPPSAGLAFSFELPFHRRPFQGDNGGIPSQWSVAQAELGDQ